MLRRNFLLASSGAAIASRLRSEVPTLLKLGFDTYTLRAFKWKALQLIDYAASQKLDTIQVSSLDDYESLEPVHLARVRKHAAAAGLTLDAGMGCICPLSYSWDPKNGDPAANIVLGLKVAKAIGATSMRCFMGSSDDRFGTAQRASQPIERLMESTIAVFKSVRNQAQELSVKIALENHAGDLRASEMRTIIEEAGPDFVGSCFDTGNTMWVAEDPLEALEVLGPYIVTTHVRDSVLYEHPRGAAVQWVALGDGTIDFPQFVARARQLCPQAAVQLEIITGRPPRVVPYLDPEFWKVLPKTPAADFARFCTLVKKSHPFNGFMVIEDGAKNSPPAFQAALREQQRVDLERSIHYGQTTLGLGARGHLKP